ALQVDRAGQRIVVDAKYVEDQPIISDPYFITVFEQRAAPLQILSVYFGSIGAVLIRYEISVVSLFQQSVFARYLLTMQHNLINFLQATDVNLILSQIEVCFTALRRI